MELKLGIDVGGTFTDVTLFDMKTGDLFFKKVPSTPESPSTSMANGISVILSETHNKPEKVVSIVHGTTLATNALIQRRGSSVALLDKGFRDVLHIGRQVRPNMNNWFVQRPAPLIPRHLRYDVSERVLYTGEIEKEIDEDGVHEIIKDLKRNKVVSVAVCFLHSYINPKNELAVKSILQKEMLDLKISLSCEILPEFREYERERVQL